MKNSDDRCQALYRAARAYEGSNQTDRHAVRMALAAAVTASVPAAAAGLSAATATVSGICSAAPGASAAGAKGILHLLLGGKLLSDVLVGTVLGAAVSTTLVIAVPAMQSRVTATTQARPASATPVRPLNSGQAPGRIGLPQNEPSAAEIAQIANEVPRITVATDLSPSRPPVAARVRSAAANSSVSPVPRQDRLLEETLALTKIQDALSRKDPNLAFALLQEQERQFPSGQLAEERAAAKVLALCAAGRNVEADQARASFYSSYPNSPLTKRVNSGCEH